MVARPYGEAVLLVVPAPSQVYTTTPKLNNGVSLPVSGTETGLMALNIKNPEVERLAAEVARLAGETKTEAIRRALGERLERLAYRVVRRDKRAELGRVLVREVWSHVPDAERGRRLTREEEDAILGYGPEGL